MKDQYKISGQTAKLEVQIEKPIVEILGAMGNYTKIT